MAVSNRRRCSAVIQGEAIEKGSLASTTSVLRGEWFGFIQAAAAYGNPAYLRKRTFANSALIGKGERKKGGRNLSNGRECSQDRFDGSATAEDPPPLKLQCTILPKIFLGIESQTAAI